MSCKVWICKMSLFGDSSEFVLEPGPEDCLVKCTVTRSSKGIDKGKLYLSIQFRLIVKMNT